MEYLEWAQAANQLNHLNLSISDKSLILIAYFLTWERSKLYALAFLIVSAFDSAIAPLIITPESKHFGFQYYSLLTSVDCILFAYILSKTNSKSQRIICGMIVTIDVLMAVGYLTGGELALYLYNNYESIVLCLHVCLILSLYKPKPIINAMVDGIRKLFRIVDDILFFSAIRYNQIRTMQMLRTV